MGARLQHVARVVRAEIVRAYPGLRVEQLDLDGSGDVSRLSIAGRADVLVAAGVISRAAMECLKSPGSGAGHGRHRALLHGRHAESWLAPFTWRIIRRSTGGFLAADAKRSGKP